MTTRGMAIGIGLLKRAGLMSTIGHGIGSAIHGGAQFGGSAMKAMGGPESLGQLAGGTAVVGAGLAGARKGKLEFDRWRVNNGLMDPNSFYASNYGA